MTTGDSSEPLSRDEIEQVVRHAVRKELSALISKVIWTILSGFVLLVGVQLLQFGVIGPAGPGSVASIGVGSVMVCSSLYLLYLLYKRAST